MMEETGRLEACSQVSVRAIETTIEECFLTESSCRLIMIVGNPGSGVYTLLARRLPELFGSRAHLVEEGAWPRVEALTGDQHVFLCPTAKDVPAAPLALPDVRVVIGCHDLADLPPWTHSYDPHERVILSLQELTHAELLDLLTARLGGHILGSTLHTLGSASGFVPSIVTEMVRVLKREGTLTNIDGTWMLTAPLNPQSFIPTLHNLLAGFNHAGQELFLNLCLKGTQVLASFDAAELLQLHELQRAGLLHMELGRVRVRARILVEVGQLCVDPHTASKTMRHALQSPDPSEEAVLWALRSGEWISQKVVLRTVQHALDAHDWSVAHQLTVLADDSWSPPDTFTCELLILRAVALRFLDEPHDALACLHHAQTLLESWVNTTQALDADVAELRVRIAVQLAEILHYKQGELNKALAELELITAKTTDTQLQSELLGQQAMHLMYGGRFTQGAIVMNHAMQRPHRSQRRIRTRLAIAQCFALTAQGDINKALRRTAQIGAHQLIPFLREQWLTEELSAAYFVSAFRAHGPAKLPRVMRRFEDASSQGYRPDHTTFQLGRAAWLLACGKVADAAREAATCFAHVQFHDPSGLSRSVAALHAHTAALTGKPHVARTMLRAARNTKPRSSAVIAGGVFANIAATEYLLGDAQATPNLLASAEAFCAEGNFGFAAEALYSGVRFGDHQAAQRLMALAPHLNSDLTRLHVRHARAIAADNPIALCAVAEELQQAGCSLFALEAFALTLMYADVPDRVVRRARHNMDTLYEQVGSLTHPLLSQQSLRHELPLTKREREIQELIIHGLSNREIAEHLTLSLRTVEGHISRLYRKTNQTRRNPMRRA